MKWKSRTLEQIAVMICGDKPESYFRYLSGPDLTRFFKDADTDFTHDGTTRRFWVADTLQKTLDFPSANSLTPPDAMLRVIRLLMDSEDAFNEEPPRLKALAALNGAIKREGFEAFYGQDDQCYLRHVGSGTVANESASPHRPFTAAETEKKACLVAYLDGCSEDDLIEHVLLPLFRQLGFTRITSAGHKDKALEYGKDIWMKFVLPTLHVIYFGIQVKKGKLDSSGVTKGGQANVAEIHNQVLMMLGHEIFDSELNRRVLVDHAFIVAGGEITKAARNWIGGKLDQSKRSQILFMDREDIVNLFVVSPLTVPQAPKTSHDPFDDPIPF
ncbi:restriction endonuclease [Pseudomonas sp. B21-012]|uniref:restriction endonuclease n=1 Tax=Pseudomonas sp. B21-012 TaxID=2895472 RepID=UPI0021608F2E|nr:restriction endonuclease [Pseudomonas sp. B21-012]UVM55426.1 restriction endonuclease [Pseudomonas sp. B21-012]